MWRQKLESFLTISDFPLKGKLAIKDYVVIRVHPPLLSMVVSLSGALALLVTYVWDEANLI